LVHAAGRDTFAGRLATARFERLYRSPPAAAAFADLMSGTDY
jgi:hypothetical protein